MSTFLNNITRLEDNFGRLRPSELCLFDDTMRVDSLVCLEDDLGLSCGNGHIVHLVLFIELGLRETKDYVSSATDKPARYSAVLSRVRPGL